MHRCHAVSCQHGQKVGRLVQTTAAKRNPTKTEAAHGAGAAAVFNTSRSRELIHEIRCWRIAEGSGRVPQVDAAIITRRQGHRPFIARYRKGPPVARRHQRASSVSPACASSAGARYHHQGIEEQGKLTPALAASINRVTQGAARISTCRSQSGARRRLHARLVRALALALSTTGCDRRMPQPDTWTPTRNCRRGRGARRRGGFDGAVLRRAEGRRPPAAAVGPRRLEVHGRSGKGRRGSKFSFSARASR